MFDQLYFYKAAFVSNYDGDTLRVDIDLGMKHWIKNIAIRMFGIDTPELRSKDPEVKERAFAARLALFDMVSGKNIVVQTMKDKSGKYGRLLAVVWVEADEGWLNVNEALLEQGHAVEYGV